MQVEDFMNRQVVTASVATSLRGVWEIICKKHVHSLPIVDQKKKLLGIITKQDLLTKIFPQYDEIIPNFSAGEDFEGDIKEKIEELKHWTAKKVMSTELVFTRPKTNVMRALSRMIVRKVRQLPVVDEKGRLVGVIAKGDIFDKLFKKNLKKLFTQTA